MEVTSNGHLRLEQSADCAVRHRNAVPARVALQHPQPVACALAVARQRRRLGRRDGLDPRRRRDRSLQLIVESDISTVETFYHRMFRRYGVSESEYCLLRNSIDSPALLLRLLWWVLRAHHYLEWSGVKEEIDHKAEGMVDDQSMHDAHETAIDELPKLLHTAARYGQWSIAQAMSHLRREITGVTCFPNISTSLELQRYVSIACQLNCCLARSGEFWCKCDGTEGVGTC